MPLPLGNAMVAADVVEVVPLAGRHCIFDLAGRGREIWHGSCLDEGEAGPSPVSMPAEATKA